MTWAEVVNTNADVIGAVIIACVLAMGWRR